MISEDEQSNTEHQDIGHDAFDWDEHQAWKKEFDREQNILKGFKEDMQYPGLTPSEAYILSFDDTIGELDEANTTQHRENIITEQMQVVLKYEEQFAVFIEMTLDHWEELAQQGRPSGQAVVQAVQSFQALAGDMGFHEFCSIVRLTHRTYNDMFPGLHSTELKRAYTQLQLKDEELFRGLQRHANNETVGKNASEAEIIMEEFDEHVRAFNAGSIGDVFIKTIDDLIETDSEFCTFLFCRFPQWQKRAVEKEPAAKEILKSIEKYNEENKEEDATNPFRMRCLRYVLGHNTFDKAFPGLQDNAELKKDFDTYLKVVEAAGRELSARALQDRVKEAEEKEKTEDRSKAKLEAWQDRRFARSLIPGTFLGILVTVLFGVTALAHWALKNGWEGPQNVFLEVIFPFAMVVGTILFAALSVGILILNVNPEIMGLGYFIGGAAAIAFLIFWKHRAVCIGMQILITALLLTYLIILIVRIGKCIRLRGKHRRAKLLYRQK